MPDGLWLSTGELSCKSTDGPTVSAVERPPVSLTFKPFPQPVQRPWLRHFIVDATLRTPRWSGGDIAPTQCSPPGAMVAVRGLLARQGRQPRVIDCQIQKRPWLRAAVSQAKFANLRGARPLSLDGTLHAASDQLHSSGCSQSSIYPHPCAETKGKGKGARR
jgi:hypothetical protein